MAEPITYAQAVTELSEEFQKHHRELIGGEAFVHLRALVAVDPRQSETCAGGCLWCLNDPCEPDCPYVAAKAFLASLEPPHDPGI